jgi:LysR family transcriptional regulator, regulator of gene expression of beta-lactamase
MALARLSLNHLHAFAAASRHLNFTRAADELCVTQAAVSHQIKALEAQIGQRLFLRTARGLQLSDEGARLAPLVQQAFALLDKAVALLDERAPPERLTVAVVGTYAQGWLLERLPRFQAEHPHIELRLQTHNNKLDLATETIDAAIRFGDGAWRSTHAQPLQAAPLAPLCAPSLAATLARPADLRRCTLLRSYRGEDWPAWSRAAGIEPLPARGPQFDSSVLMVQAAMLGSGVALAPAAMFRRELAEGRLVQPFAVAVDVGRYWLTRPLGREPSAALRAFEVWLRADAVPHEAQPVS